MFKFDGNIKKIRFKATFVSKGHGADSYIHLKIPVQVTNLLNTNCEETEAGRFLICIGHPD